VQVRRCVAAVAIAGFALIAVPSAAFAQQADGYGTDPVPPAVLPAAVTVPAATTPPKVLAGSTIPLTGADVAGLVALGFGACAVGTGLVVAGKRRTRLAS
jgi:hypothetical protein